MAKDSIVEHIFGIIDASVELYLVSIIKPFLKLHEKFYGQLNKVLNDLIEQHGPLPTWCTANFVTYARTMLVIPLLLFMSWGHRILPAIIVIVVDIGDFFDGVVARYWVEELKKKKRAAKNCGDDVDVSSDDTVRSKTSDDDDFQVVSTGSSQIIRSWIVNQRKKTYGGFIDAICDKAFLIPCWIFLFERVPGLKFGLIAYGILICLILAETASGAVRFKAYYTSGGIPAPTVKNMDFTSSAVKADHLGKAKQTFEMVGTSLFILPYLHIFGMFLMTLAVPLAYESVRRKVKNRVIYVDGTVPKLDHHVLKFWIQAKGLGSKLVVGVYWEGKADLVLNACAVACVDEVIAEAPKLIDMRFLNKYKIDYVVCLAGKQGIATDDVLECHRCLAIGDDGAAHPVGAKGARRD